MSKRIDPHCRAFQNAVDLLARPWTGLILSLLQNGPLRFSEIEERTHGVGAKTLSARPLEVRVYCTRTGGPAWTSRATTLRAFEQVAAAIERWGRELVADD